MGFGQKRAGAGTPFADAGIRQDHRRVGEKQRSRNEHDSKPENVRPESDREDKAQCADPHRNGVTFLPFADFFALRSAGRRDAENLLLTAVRLAVHTVNDTRFKQSDMMST